MVQAYYSPHLKCIEKLQELSRKYKELPRIPCEYFTRFALFSLHESTHHHCDLFLNQLRTTAEMRLRSFKDSSMYFSKTRTSVIITQPPHQEIDLQVKPPSRSQTPFTSSAPARSHFSTGCAMHLVIGLCSLPQSGRLPPPCPAFHIQAVLKEGPYAYFLRTTARLCFLGRKAPEMMLGFLSAVPQRHTCPLIPPP